MEPVAFVLEDNKGAEKRKSAVGGSGMSKCVDGGFPKEVIPELFLQ